MARVIRVLLVDDDALVRAGLSMMLDGVAGISVVGEAADGQEAVTATDAHAPDVVLMDLRMLVWMASPPPAGSAPARARRR